MVKLFRLVLMLSPSLKKYEILSTVVSVPTIQSLDDIFVLELCKSHKSIVVYEEHSIHVELEEAIARLLTKYSIACKFVSLGIPDEPIYNGSQWDCFGKL